MSLFDPTPKAMDDYVMYHNEAVDKSEVYDKAEVDILADPEKLSDLFHAQSIEELHDITTELHNAYRRRDLSMIAVYYCKIQDAAVETEVKKEVGE